MRVPILSKPVLRHKSQRISVAARSSGVTISQALLEEEEDEEIPFDEGEIGAEEHIELPLDFADGEDELSATFEEGGAELI